MTLCPECGVLLKAGNNSCWSCGSSLGIPADEEDGYISMKDWAAAILMLAVPLLAYYIIYLKGL
jgi:hypothetical protein